MNGEVKAKELPPRKRLGDWTSERALEADL